jgi:hypothetical protein
MVIFEIRRRQKVVCGFERSGQIAVIARQKSSPQRQKVVNHRSLIAGRQSPS